MGPLRFGAELRATGKAPKPVYLEIIDGAVEICDASQLLGKKDLLETHD